MMGREIWSKAVDARGICLGWERLMSMKGMTDIFIVAYPALIWLEVHRKATMLHSCVPIGRMFFRRVKPRSAPGCAIPRYEANQELQYTR